MAAFRSRSSATIGVNAPWVASPSELFAALVRSTGFGPPPPPPAGPAPADRARCTGTAHTSTFLVRSLSNRIQFPPGANDGFESAAGSAVRFVWLEPSAFIEYTSRLPSRSEANTSDCASGDQSPWLSAAELFVRRCTPEPSGFIV